MNYGEVVRAAFWITLRNRFLWVFGFLLGGGQVFNLLQNANNLSRQGSVSFLGDDAALYVFEARQLVLDNLVLLLGLTAALVLAGIFLSLTAQGALIESVAALHRGEERRFSSSFRAGLSNFWRVLGFSALLVLISIGIGLLVVLPTVFLLVGTLSATESSTAGIAIFTLVVLLIVGVFFLIFIPLGIIVALGLRTLVLDREGVLGSFGSGYGLLVRHPGRVLLVAVIGFALSLGSGLALLIASLLPGLLLAVPALILFAANLGTAGVVAGAVAAVILLILYLIAAAVVATFNHAYWTLAYLRLTTLPE